MAQFGNGVWIGWFPMAHEGDCAYVKWRQITTRGGLDDDITVYGGSNGDEFIEWGWDGAPICGIGAERVNHNYGRSYWQSGSGNDRTLGQGDLTRHSAGSGNDNICGCGPSEAPRVLAWHLAHAETDADVGHQTPCVGLVQGACYRLSPNPTAYRQIRPPIAKSDRLSPNPTTPEEHRCDGKLWALRPRLLVTSFLAMGMLLVHVGDGERRVVDSSSIYYAEAVGGDTVVRRRGAKPLHDVRELRDIERAWKRHGFVRIHDNHLVHPGHILHIRKRGGTSWEVTMAPPVNVVLPVSRRRLAALWRAFEG